MKKETKKQLFAIVVLLLFMGSSIAYAVISIVPKEETGQKKIGYVVNQPLTENEEAYYLQQNIVVMKYFYSEDCVGCKSTESIIDQATQYFNGKLLVEKIDMNKYANETSDLSITKAPTIYLKGNSIDVITEDITYNQLITKICVLFFNYVNECSI